MSSNKRDKKTTAATEEEENAVATQTKKKKSTRVVFLRAKSLNRIMRVVWPMVSRPLASRRKKAAIKKAARLKMVEGKEDAAAAVEANGGEEADATVGQGDTCSQAEGLNLCGLLEEAGSRGVRIDLSAYLGSHASLALGVLDLDFNGIGGDNPDCVARICCSHCHKRHLSQDSSSEEDSEIASCGLLAAAVESGVQIDLGKLLLGHGDILDVVHHGDSALSSLLDEFPNCQLCVCCLSCHWERQKEPELEKAVFKELDQGEADAVIVVVVSGCNDCSVVDGEVFHEDGCLVG
jgi:hypothetical protein